MSELLIGKLLLALSLLLGATYLLGGLLTRYRIPAILGALFVAMFAHYTAIGDILLSRELYPAFSFLADLGVLFLLFFIGLQIDLREMRQLSRDIIWLTILNTAFPFLFGMLVMLVLGYGWVLAFVIGLSCMPTAEAVIVPILDEFNLIRTRVGQFVVGAGVMDDVIEVFLVAFVSVWIGEKTAATTVAATLVESEVLRLTISIGIFIVLAWLCYRWLAGWLSHWLPSHPRHLTLLSMLILFGFGGFAESSELGMVVGAITAGVILRPVYNRMAAVGEHTTQAIRAVTYGFLGLVFFFWVGLSVDLESMLTAPMLTILLYLAATLGKLAGVFIMVPMRRLNSKEAWTVGIGLNARLTTEIVVAKLLLDAKLIDAHVFTALVSAASFSAITVPLVFAFLVRAWGDQLRYTPSRSPLEEDNAR